MQNNIDTPSNPLDSSMFRFPYKSLVILTGTFSTLLGAAVLLGWYTHNISLIQIRPEFVPMQYNTALGFFLCGFALFFLFLDRERTAGVFGLAIMLIGGLTLIEYVWTVDLSIDQIFMHHYITTKTSHPGRMAPNTALCF